MTSSEVPQIAERAVHHCGYCLTYCTFAYRAEQTFHFIVAAKALSVYLMKARNTTGLLLPLATLPIFQPLLQDEHALH